MIPKFLFFTRGVGRNKKELQSFESALRDAGISFLNLVTVSSIFPPNCKEISREEGMKRIKPGQITFCVMARHSSNEKNRLVSASIGVAKPRDENHYGYLSEHHSFGQDEDTAGNFAEDLAASMLASTLGIPFDIDANYDDKREIFHLSDKIIETKSTTATAIVEKDGEYTTVIAAAVFILE
ncbi:Pyruvoyl-dependent arginine decarboxylase [Candidatus Lokiarchaeum ossiferum]|uniref:Pyruvoyl-dependent arginine decarboxylase n=1 Tax=Candidatus Lokiarchaeum ossiferum TaxID=2951803 RepID=A0ABY6HQK8_9ARCH|nr:Pyruvoyl-dependent arginine decarboxylase [Candidatus Lokiarchaeum sp. B-35]